MGEIDIILSDVVLPGMNGRQFVQEVRRRRPEIPVIYVSGYTNEPVVHDALNDMGTRFIQKPFGRNDLAYEVRQALDSSSFWVPHA
jgi:DNA-binding NtrC family response regulator